MKLYELTSIFVELFNRFDYINAWEPATDADGQPIDEDGNLIDNLQAYKDKMLSAWFDTLEGIEGEFDIKAENMATYIKELKAEIAMLKSEASSLKTRISKKEKSVESLINYLLNSMKATGRKKIEMPRAVISLRNNAPSLVVEDELGFIEWAEANGKDELLKYLMPEVKKNDTKALVKAGEKIPFVHLETTTSVIIK